MPGESGSEARVSFKSNTRKSTICDLRSTNLDLQIKSDDLQMDRLKIVIRQLLNRQLLMSHGFSSIN